MNATDPKYIASLAAMIVQSLTDGDDQPEDFDTAYGILCRFAVDVLNEAQGAVLDALRRPRDEAHNALSHLSQRLRRTEGDGIQRAVARTARGMAQGPEGGAMDSNDRVRFLAEEKERAWATERDTIERGPLADFSIGDVRGAFDAGWDCGVIVMEREMSARVRNLESKLVMAIADDLIERTKP